MILHVLGSWWYGVSGSTRLCFLLAVSAIFFEGLWSDPPGLSAFFDVFRVVHHHYAGDLVLSAAFDGLGFFWNIRVFHFAGVLPC